MQQGAGTLHRGLFENIVIRFSRLRQAINRHSSFDCALATGLNKFFLLFWNDCLQIMGNHLIVYLELAQL